MILTIHRGSKEIGGSCVELRAGSTRILIDLGSPLTDEKVVVGENLKSVDAVLVSHPHGDHCGLIDQLPDGLPVYLGELTEDFIQASMIFNRKPLLKNNFRNFQNRKPFHIGCFEVTPYLMDHSSSDAFAFLIEADGKRVFYTGDFRAHGRKAKLFRAMLAHPVTNIDVMLMEGTMIGRENGKYLDEESVETAMRELMMESPGLCFLQTSPQNIDRIVSAYKACRDSGRIFVIDIYTAWILRELHKFSKSKKTPDMNWKTIKVLSRSDLSKNHRIVLTIHKSHFGDFYKDLYSRDNVIAEGTISAHPEKYLVKTSYVERLIEETGVSASTVIYSMWEGYLEEKFNPRHFHDYVRLRNRPGVRFEKIHTGGHATRDDLKRFAEAINSKALVPIHTQCPEQFSGIFRNVVLLADGQEMSVP
ncbi:MAG: MBL fold metallo-hydrolase [Victivallales bacterium]